MKSTAKIILIWFIASPVLLTENLGLPWYKKLFIVLLSPCMVFFALLFYTVLTPSAPYVSFESEHQFKGSDDLSKLTRTYIPPCDTLCAIHSIIGVDDTTNEKFLLKDILDAKDYKALKRACRHNEAWTETDSTFVYKHPCDPEHPTGLFDFFTLTIPKHEQVMTATFGHY